MKILITGTTGESMPPPYGGVPKLCLLCASCWKRQGHDVAITFTYKPEKADDLNAGAKYFFEYKKKPSKFDKLFFLIKYFLKNPKIYFRLFFSYIKIVPVMPKEAVLYSAYGVFINDVVSSFKPDIILSEAALVKTFMVAKIANMHNIAVAFDTYAEIHDMSMGANVFLGGSRRDKYWKSFMDLAGIIIPPGPHCSRGPLSYASKEKVQFVYDGSDYSLSKINIDEDKAKLRDLMKLPKDLFLVGNVGAFEGRKGHDYLIKAVARLVKDGYPVGAVICGGSGDSTKWRNLAKEEGVSNNVFLFGRLSELDLARVYKSIDIYSDMENTPRACGLNMAILEAMSMRLPVVIFDNPEMHEIVKEGENGFIVPINDIEALSLGILKMYQLDKNKRVEMGIKSYNYAKNIDIDFTANEKMKLFEKIIKNKL